MRAILAGKPPIDLIIRRSARARRISLRVSRLDGRVTLTMPPHAPLEEAVGFARSRADWVRRSLAQIQPRRELSAGSAIDIEGRRLEIRLSSTRRAEISCEILHVPDGRPVGPSVAAFLKFLARERAAEAVARHSAAVDLAPRRLSLRDTRSRWGSCSPSGALMLSWRLVMAPPAILDYVAAHEVAHLVHLDHSPDFWRLTERLYPDWRGARSWLRENGASLHAVDFA